MPNRLVLIDPFNFFHRSFHAFPMELTTPDGKGINAVYGFASLLFALVKELAPTHLAAAMESRERLIREVEFPAYKATRVPMPPEERVAFDAQLPLLIELLGVLRVKAVGAAGFEADDVIGTLAKEFSGKAEVIAASNDRDMMQLVGGSVRFYRPAVGKQEAKLYGENEFFEEYGFKPARMVDYKALRGDPSDNIPGVRGIGEKTAADLIKKYGTVSEIYRHLPELKPAVAQKLKGDRKNAILSEKLARIVTDVPVDARLEELRFGGFAQPQVRAIFEKWGFRSLLKKIGEKQSEEGRDQMKLL